MDGLQASSTEGLRLIVRRGLRPVSVVALVASASAYATGFYIDQQSVRGLGAVNAGIVATADDPSTIWFNPAGLTQLWSKGPTDHNNWAEVGVQLIIPKVDIRNSGAVAATPGTLYQPLPYAGDDLSNSGAPAPIPNLYLAHRSADGRWFLGLGVTSPFGLATHFNDEWFGRYDATKASLLTINFGGVAAYAIDDHWSIGGGVDLQYANSELINAIPNPLTIGGPTVTTDGRADTYGHAWTLGFNIGVLYRPDSDTNIGAHFRSAMKHNISGASIVSGLSGDLAPANGTFGVSADLKLPAMASVGVVRKLTAELAVLAQFEWYGWNSFNEIRIRFANGSPDIVRATNYRDTWALAVGGDYEFSPGLVIRGGVRYDRTPTTDGYRDTTLPDTDRWWLGLGGTYRISERCIVDFALNHTLYSTGRIDVTRSYFDSIPPLTSNVRVVGNSTPSTSTVSIGVRYAF